MKRGDLVVAVPDPDVISSHEYHRLLNMPHGLYVLRLEGGRILYRQFIDKITYDEVGIFLGSSSDGKSCLILTPRGFSGWIKTGLIEPA